MRKGISSFALLSSFSETFLGGAEKLIQEDADWGKIVCRCEEVTIAEVKHALLSSPGLLPWMV